MSCVFVAGLMRAGPRPKQLSGRKRGDRRRAGEQQQGDGDALAAGRAPQALTRDDEEQDGSAEQADEEFVPQQSVAQPLGEPG